MMWGKTLLAWTLWAEMSTARKMSAAKMLADEISWAEPSAPTLESLSETRAGS